jgi:hypothetical protein
MLIVTHKGAAHRDEFLASCLLVARYTYTTIVRRDCTPTDLTDMQTIVLDQGGQFDLANSNLDHHQLSRDAVPTCSITQVLRYLGIDTALAREVWPWLEFSERLDSKGPIATASYYGISQDSLMATISPIEDSVLRWFQGETDIAPHSALHKLMCRIGTYKLEYLETVIARLALLNDIATTAVPNGVSVLEIIDIDRSATPILGVEIFIKRAGICPDVIVSQDDRGEGYSLYRRNDSPRVDFSRLEGHPDVTFAHKSGFIAKTVAHACWSSLITLATTRVPAADQV